MFTPWLTHQGSVEASTCGGANASLLAQQLDGRLDLSDSLRMATRIRLAVIPSTDEALRDLGTFAFVTLHLFSAGERHSSAVDELLRLIERLEELHTEVQGMISSPHLATTLLYDVSWRWSKYLNRCVAASASEVEEAPGDSVPFSLKPILVELEGGRYIGPILPAALADLVAGRRPTGGSTPKGGGGGGSGGGGHKIKNSQPMVAASGGSTRVRVRYDTHLPSLSLRDGEQTRLILTGAVLSTLCVHVICKNWHMCWVCWEDCKHTNSHVPTPPEAANTIAKLLKVARGE